MPYEEFEGKVVLITGAAGGIGQRLCARFEACGARVYATDILPLDRPRFTRGDLSQPAFPGEWARSVHHDAGRIDVLVNNAGICPRTSLPEISLAEWQQVLAVNLTAAFLLCQACLELMIPQRAGAMVNLASLAGKVGGLAVGAHYSASKAAIACLTKSLARCGAPHGIRVNAVAPGIIDTEMTHAATPAQLAALTTTIPLGRLGQADEVVGPIMFLASGQASYVTGAVLDINGGLLMD